jgi:SulP family sulfate permease
MLGLIVIAVVLAIKRWRSIWPGTLIAIVFVGILLTVFHLDSRGVQVVGSVSGSLPPLHLPKWELWHQIGTLAPAALAITILGLMEAIFVCNAPAGQRIPFYVCFGHMIEILNHEIEKHH